MSPIGPMDVRDEEEEEIIKTGERVLIDWTTDTLKGYSKRQ